MDDRFELTRHALDMIRERGIDAEWVWTALSASDRAERDGEGNIHYFRAVPEYGGRILHVVVNPNTEPHKVATLFFDRRQRRQT